MNLGLNSTAGKSCFFYLNMNVSLTKQSDDPRRGKRALTFRKLTGSQAAYIQKYAAVNIHSHTCEVSMKTYLQSAEKKLS